MFSRIWLNFEAKYFSSPFKFKCTVKVKRIITEVLKQTHEQFKLKVIFEKKENQYLIEKML